MTVPISDASAVNSSSPATRAAPASALRGSSSPSTWTVTSARPKSLSRLATAMRTAIPPRTRGEVSAMSGSSRGPSARTTSSVAVTGSPSAPRSWVSAAAADEAVEEALVDVEALHARERDRARLVLEHATVDDERVPLDAVAEAPPLRDADGEAADRDDGADREDAREAEGDDRGGVTYFKVRPGLPRLALEVLALDARHTLVR